MRRALLVAAIVFGAVAIYAAAAPGGQQAVTPKQFKALQKRVSTLEAVISLCFQNAIPVSQYGGANGVGYTYKNPDGTTVQTSALDVTVQGDTPGAWALDVGADCANAINSSALGYRTPTRAHVRLHANGLSR
jgi:hypothetical protein